jgi:putative serine protease PepD
LTDKPVPVDRGLDQAAVESIVLETLATQALPARAAPVAAALWPSIVQIRTLDGEPPPANLISGPGKGTGFVIKEDGTILTNHHVIAGSDRIVVTFADGLVSPAAVASAQPERDLAILVPARIPDDLKPVTMAAAGQLVPGDLVIAVGFPFSLGASVTAGVVSGLDREYPLPGRAPLTGLIQFDAAVNPGSSGGPLVNGSGEVIGVNTAIASLGAFNGAAGSIGLGFAIPIDTAKRIVNEIISTGSSSTPVIGVQLDMSFTGPGAKVAEVTPDSGAAQAGIRDGDVITAINGSVIADPTDSSNKVARVIKSGGAELWAGTTIATLPGAAISVIPITSSRTRMSVRVWTDKTNIPVRLKVETSTDPTKSVETEARTTAVSTWHTLTFDFANEAPGTAALNPSYTFDKISIFFDFGRSGPDGGGGTYYFDDIDLLP